MTGGEPRTIVFPSSRSPLADTVAPSPAAGAGALPRGSPRRADRDPRGPELHDGRSAAAQGHRHGARRPARLRAAAGAGAAPAAAYVPAAPSIPEIAPAPAPASRPTQEDLAALDALLNPSASGQLGKSPVERPRPEKWEPQFRPPTTPPRKAPARPAAASSPSRVPLHRRRGRRRRSSRRWARGTSSCARPLPPPGPARCRRRGRPRPRRRPRWPPPRSTPTAPPVVEPTAAATPAPTPARRPRRSRRPRRRPRVPPPTPRHATPTPAPAAPAGDARALLAQGALADAARAFAASLAPGRPRPLHPAGPRGLRAGERPEGRERRAGAGALRPARGPQGPRLLPPVLGRLRQPPRGRGRARQPAVVLPAGRRCRLASRLSPSSSPERAAPAPPARGPRGSRGNGGGRLRRPQERPGDRGRPGLVRGLGAPLSPERDGLRGRPARSSRGSTPPTGARRSRTRTPGTAASASPPGTRPRRCASRAWPSSASPRPCPRSRRSPRPRSPSARWRARERPPRPPWASSRATRDPSSCSGTLWSRAATSPRPASRTACRSRRPSEPRVRKKLDALGDLRRLRLERAVPHPLRRRRRRAARPRRPARARLRLGGVRAAPRLRAEPAGHGGAADGHHASATRRGRRTGRRPGTTGRSACPVAGVDRPTPGLVRVLRHELAHSFVAARAGASCPTWLHEGLAQWLEGGDPEREDPGLARLARESRLPRLESLERPFVGMSEAAATAAYAQSLSAVAHLLRSGGEAGVRRLIEALGRGLPATEALPAAFGLSYGELQRAWEAHLLAAGGRRRRRPRAQAFAERACKPDSVPAARAAGDDHSSSPEVTRGVQQPTRGPRPGRPQTPLYSVLLRVGFSLPAVSPRRRCALTAPFHPCHPRGFPREFGGVFSVALSLGSPPLAVNQHAALWSPDFPPRLIRRRGDRPARSANTSRVAPRSADLSFRGASPHPPLSFRGASSCRATRNPQSQRRRDCGPLVARPAWSSSG